MHGMRRPMRCELVAMRCELFAMQCAARGAGGAMLLTEGFLGWLSRFKGMGGWAGGYKCIWFCTTNKPPGRRDTMILGIFYVHL
jgi:hypothetical protein